MLTLIRKHLYIILLLCCCAARAQEYNLYYADLYNGLPANTVYSTTVDSHGYLWVCTDKGIARYNGYKYSIYTTDDGLPSSDIWMLHPDAKGRLWLGTRAHRTGYILNNRYRDVHVPADADMLYIRNIADYGHGIVLQNLTPRMLPDGFRFTMYTERNDSLLPHYIIAPDIECTGNTYFVPRKNETIVYRFDANSQLRIAQRTPVPFIIRGTLRFFYAVNGNRLSKCAEYSNELETLDLTSGRIKKTRLFSEDHKPETIFSIKATDYGYMIVTQKNIIKLDTLLNRTGTQPISAFAGTDAVSNVTEIMSILEDSSWGRIVTTNSHGFYLNHNKNDLAGTRIPVNLSGYRCLNTPGDDTISYWWRNKDRTLLTVTQNGKAVCKRYNHIFDAVRIQHYAGDTALLASKSGLYFYRYSNRTATHVMYKAVFVYPGKVQQEEPGRIPYTRDISVIDRNNVLLSGNHINHLRFHSDTMTFRQLKSTSYHSLRTDAAHKITWSYNADQATLLDALGSHMLPLNRLVKNLGITDIENAGIHTASGCILVKDQDRLLLINLLRGTVRQLFSSFNLKDARFGIHKDLVVLAGRFGVLFCKLSPNGNPAHPLVLTNFRNNEYFQVQDMALLEQAVILKTDKSTLRVKIPPDTALNNPAPVSGTHKMVISYNDSLYDLPMKDTLSIAPGHDKMLTDVISPEGNGSLHFRYRLQNGAWQSLNDNELKLPPMEPGQYYTLQLSANDDVWTGSEIPLTLYMVPEWWQRPVWAAVIKICITLVILLFLLAVILATRYFANRAAERKQLLSSLEYRVIHSQINPHFIFNTLNTALYFIKKGKTTEAVAHVNRFSKLLRGYLEASQNGYISLADEIAGLRSYIELQQTRFEDIFTYEIIIDDLIPAALVYIPAMLLQPIVENAINHGLTPRGSGGHLHLSFSSTDDGGIVCLVDDNGIGRKKSAAGNPAGIGGRVSHGNRLTEELVDAFNRYEKMGISIIYTDKEYPQTGTCVTITIKQPRNEPK